MSFFNFDNKRIQQAFNRIASVDNKANRIDSEREENALANLLSGAKRDITKHDIALLQSQALNFDNKDIKREYKAIAKKSGDREINTDEEYDLAKQFLENNRDNMSPQDISIWENMMEAYQPENPKIIINANVEEGAVLQIAIGENLTNSVSVGDVEPQLPIEQKEEEPVVQLEEENSIDVVDNNDEVEVEPQPLESSAPATREYSIKKGDYWYSMIMENYNVSSHSDIMKIVRILKEDYFDKHKTELTKQGYNSAKAGFFLKVGEVYNLPQTVEIDGKIVELK